MKIVKFKEANVQYGLGQEDKYNVMHAYRDNMTSEVPVTTCWKLSFFERLQVLFTGKIYYTLLSFNQPLQPQYASTKFKKYAE